MTDFLFQFARIPDGWFLDHLGEDVKPIYYRDEEHENTGKGFKCALQHRTGGKYTVAYGDNIAQALYAAIEEVCHRWPDFVP